VVGADGDHLEIGAQGISDHLDLVVEPRWIVQVQMMPGAPGSQVQREHAQDSRAGQRALQRLVGPHQGAERQRTAGDGDGIRH